MVFLKHHTGLHGEMNSLIPRPFPPPVFDRLQDVYMEGGRPRRFRHVRWFQVDKQ